MAKRQFEYYIREVSVGEFEVSKFDSMEGGEQPLATYNVQYNPPKVRGKCNCHAGTYRSTGETDKHVTIVKEWIAAGRTTTAILR